MYLGCTYSHGVIFKRPLGLILRRLLIYFFILDNISWFNDAYMERLYSLEKDLIQGCMDFTWVSGSVLILKIHAFQKYSTGQKM